MNLNWYENFFHGVALDLWRQAVTPQQTREEADFIQRILDCPVGAHLLDVPCGNGRHTRELAARGYRISSVDIASEFVHELREEAKDLAVDVVLGDMRELSWTSELDGAFCFGNSFGYMDHEGTCIFLTAVSRALRPGSRFIVDTGVMAESLFSGVEEHEWMQIGDIQLLADRKYEVAEGRLDIVYTFVRDGKRDTRPSCVWVFTVAEVRRMLRQAGLSLVELYSSLDEKPFEVGSPRLLLVAQKDLP